jgi:ABC-type nitrate/sulfonate/bicarbonate transport system substrate-binding protein
MLDRPTPRFRPLALTATFALAFAACSAAATPAPTAAPTAAPAATSAASAAPTAAGTLPPKFTVRFLASAGALGDWAPYVGKANGYFTAQNIDVQYSSFANAGDVFNAIVSGQGDLAIISLPTALTAALQNAPAKLIAAAQYSKPGSYDSRWGVLDSSPIKSVSDLKGKKVNIFAQSSLAQAITRAVLGKAGIGASDYTEVSVPFAQAYTALESGQVDISLFIEPFYSNSNSLLKSKNQPPLRVIYQYMTYFTEGVNTTGMMANTDWAAKNKDGLKRFFQAWFQAAKWGNDPNNRSLLRSIIANGAGVAADSIANIEPALVSEDGKFLPGFLPKFQDLLVTNQMVKGMSAALAEDKFVDLSYLP